MSHASEQNTRRELANELQRRGASPSGVLHASEFQDALDQLGLRFGSPVVDRIMLACSIDGDGHVRVHARARANCRPMPFRGLQRARAASRRSRRAYNAN